MMRMPCCRVRICSHSWAALVGVAIVVVAEQGCRPSLRTDGVPVAPALAPALAARSGAHPVTAGWLLKHYASFAVALPTLHWLKDGIHLVYEVGDTRTQSQHIELLDARSRRRTILGEGWEPLPSPDGQLIAFLDATPDNGIQLWVMRAHGAERRVLSRVPGGLSQRGFEHAFVWSPDSRFIALSFRPPFRRRQKPIVVADSITPSVVVANAPATEPPDSQLWILDAASGAARLLYSEPALIHDLRWPQGAASDNLLLTSIRYGFEYGGERTTAAIRIVKILDGATRTLTILDGQHQNLNPDIAPDGRRLAITMDFDNAPVASLLTSIGSLSLSGTGQSYPTRLTHDSKLLSARWSRDGARLYALRVYGAYRQVYAIDPASGSIRQITTDPITIDGYALAPDGTEMATIGRDAHGRLLISEVMLDRSTTPRTSRRIAELTGPPPDVQLCEVREIQWRGSQGQLVRGLLLYPLNYRVGDRYPLVVDVHGGGWGSAVRPTYGSLLGNTPLEWQLWAQKGYAVLVPDYSSSGAYGEAAIRELFERHAIYEPDFKDIMAGVNRVIALGVADSTRMAVYGHSAGASLTNWIITHTARFRAAVSYEGLAEVQLSSCIGSVIGCEWNMRWAMGGWPWEKPEVYRRNSATTYAAQARTPTLFLMSDPDHGGIDETGSVQFLYAALRRRGVDTQFVRYLNEGHVLAAPANRSDAFNRAVAWIDSHLSGGATSAFSTGRWAARRSSDIWLAGR